MRILQIPAAIVLSVSLISCGGSGNSGSGSPQFTIASGNWSLPLISMSSEVGGQLTQNGNTISGIFHVSGSPCFDPVADALTVKGQVSGNGLTPLTLTTTPVRGQTLSISATWDNSLNPGLPTPTSPPNPVENLVGTWQISGGNCTGSAPGHFQLIDFTNTWTGTIGSNPGPGPTWGGQFNAALKQTGPDLQGFFQFSGTFTISGSPCFTNGTITSGNFAGNSAPVTAVMDSGQMTGSAEISNQLFAGVNTVNISFNLVVHGGSCDGQSVSGAGSFA